jgi:signal transduction histidine kinase
MQVATYAHMDGNANPEPPRSTAHIAHANGGVATQEARGGEPIKAGNSTEIGELAHELRTPLAAIAALAEVMRAETFGAIPERYREYIRGMHESAGHALGVLSDWVARTSDDAGPQPARAALDVNALVAACMSVVAPLARRSGLQIACCMAPTLPAVIADARGLKQVLFNLLTNAFTFTPPRGEVTITTELSGSDVVIEVADTGDGMAEDELRRVRAFGCAPRVSEAGRSGRMGYGLPLVFQITQANGGTVEIASALRKGTRVRLTFPGTTDPATPA